MSKITEKVTKIVKPIVEEEGCILWDVEYVREAGNYYLRIFIDKEEGMSIDDCERVSRRIDPVLDEADPIPESYIFEVCSAGIERELKYPWHFESFIGSTVEIKTYSPIDGRKSLVGELEAYNSENGNVTLKIGEESIELEPKQIAQARLYVEF